MNTTPCSGSGQQNQAIGSTLDSFLKEARIYGDVVRKAQVEVIGILNPDMAQHDAYQKTLSALDAYLAAKDREQALLGMMRSSARKRSQLYRNYLFEFDRLKKHPSFTAAKQQTCNEVIDHLKRTASKL